jgi:hypothetical protein
MPNRSPRVVSEGTIGDLGLPGRAVTALTRAGITRVDDLAVLTRQELAAIPGLGAGMIAAIRLVVPDPTRGVPRTGPVDGPAEEESPAAPTIPSFDSLRGSRRRTAMDVLVPESAPGPSVTAPVPAAPPPSPAGPPRPAAGPPRPPEYADLLRLGVCVVRAVAGVPGRVVLWSVREPVRLLRRVLGAT